MAACEPLFYGQSRTMGVVTIEKEKRENRGEEATARYKKTSLGWSV